LFLWFKKNQLAEIKHLQFEEPKKYLPPRAWINHLLGKVNDIPSIDALSGATLTRKSTIDLVKQALYFEKL